jgi:hypothetical protein
VLGLAEGETSRIVVSPTGMLHAGGAHYKDKGHLKHTACGKSMNEKWMYCFARGASIHQLYRFSHKACSHCMSIGRELYPGEAEKAREDYKEVWEAALALAREALREGMDGKIGDLLRHDMALNEKKFETLANILTSSKSTWQKSAEIDHQVFPGANTWEIKEKIKKDEVPLTQNLKRFFAAEVAKRALAAPRGQVATFLLTPSTDERAMPNLIPQALTAYGDLGSLPLPGEVELAELLNEDVERNDIHSFIQDYIIPKLLVTTWLNGLMESLREAYPENGGSLHPTILKAYRIMPGRKPKHTLGTHALNLGELFQALDSQRKQLGMNWESVAAEMNLTPENILALSKGEKPDVDTFLTLGAWVSDYSRYSAPLDK